MAKTEIPQALKEAAFLNIFFRLAREHGINPREVYLRLKRENPGVVTRANSERFDDLVERVRKSAESVHRLKTYRSKSDSKRVCLQNPRILYSHLTGEKAPRNISCHSLNFAVAFYFPFRENGYQENWAEVSRGTGIDFLRDGSEDKAHVIPVIRVNSDHGSIDRSDRLLSAIFGEDYQQRVSLEHGLKHNIDPYFLNYTGCLGEFSATLYQPSRNPIELNMAYNDDISCLMERIAKNKKYVSIIRDICSERGEMIGMAINIVKKHVGEHKKASAFKARILKTIQELLNMDVSPKTLSFVISAFPELPKLYKELISIREGLYLKVPDKQV